MFKRCKENNIDYLIEHADHATDKDQIEDTTSSLLEDSIEGYLTEMIYFSEATLPSKSAKDKRILSIAVPQPLLQMVDPDVALKEATFAVVGRLYESMSAGSAPEWRPTLALELAQGLVPSVAKSDLLKSKWLDTTKKLQGLSLKELDRLRTLLPERNPNDNGLRLDSSAVDSCLTGKFMRPR